MQVEAKGLVLTHCTSQFCGLRLGKTNRLADRRLGAIVHGPIANQRQELRVASNNRLPVERSLQRLHIHRRLCPLLTVLAGTTSTPALPGGPFSVESSRIGGPRPGLAKLWDSV